MKRIYLSIFIITLLACKDKNTPVTKYTIEQFYKNVSISGGSFSSDESKLLVSSNESGIYNIYEIDIESGQQKQITRSTEESYFINSYLPNSDDFIYSHDKGGNENYKICLKSVNGIRDLTPCDSTRNVFLCWSRDEQSMFYISNKRNPKCMDLFELPISAINNDNPEAKMIYQNNDGLDVKAISPNKNLLILTEEITNANMKMYLYDRIKSVQIDISNHEGDAEYYPQFFSLDNKELYYTTNENSNFKYVAKRNLETGKIEKVFETNWDVWYVYDSWNGKYRVIGINADAKTKIVILNQNIGEEVKFPEIEGGSISSVNISKSEKLALLYASTSSSPSNLYVYYFETGKLKKLTNTLNPEINLDDLVEGHVVHYQSFDGIEIPAIYYQPREADKNNKVPALIWVHGGPGGQSRLSYRALIQYLVNHGYAILAVNNRGSSGYGKEFFHMDDKNHGDKDLKDCIAGKDFFASTGVVDMNKVGIIGGSYGGYMTMAALTFEPEAFNVGVNIFGVTNWLRTLKSIPPHWESYRKALYDELGDPFSADSVRLYEISPLFHADNVTKPLMVLQGANDIRVLQVESDEIVEAVKVNNIPVDYIVFEDEGHGFRKKENEIEGYGKIKAFLDKYLKETEK